MRKLGHHRILLRTEHTLRQTLAVTQVDKDDAAVVARGIHPTDQADGFADVVFFEFVAVVCSHGRVKERFFNRRWTGWTQMEEYGVFEWKRWCVGMT